MPSFSNKILGAALLAERFQYKMIYLLWICVLIRSPLDARLGAEQGVYHFCVEIGGIWLDFCQESRHGAGFWQEGMERLTDEEFMVKVVAGGRAYALKMVGKPWRAHRLVMFTF